MESLIQDLKYGLKLLWKDKAYAATAVATLAICIGANTAIFSVVNSVVLKPLPFPESDRILFMYNSYPNSGAPMAGTGVPDYYVSPQRLQDALADSVARRKIELLLLEDDRFRTVVLDYAEGPKYVELVRDDSKPNLLAEILKPIADRPR